MENQLSPETKLLIKKIIISSIIAILLIVFTWLALSNAQKKSRDIQRLSAIRSLQADLKIYYYYHNVFPHKILNINKVEDKEKDCEGNLCLDFIPVDPLSGQEYQYFACFDSLASKCNDEIKYPGGYKIKYFLESNSKSLPKGVYWATAGKIY